MLRPRRRELVAKPGPLGLELGNLGPERLGRQRLLLCELGPELGELLGGVRVVARSDRACGPKLLELVEEREVILL